jgi:hypothetical protein
MTVAVAYPGLAELLTGIEGDQQPPGAADRAIVIAGRAERDADCEVMQRAKRTL